MAQADREAREAANVAPTDTTATEHHMSAEEHANMDNAEHSSNPAHGH